MAHSLTPNLNTRPDTKADGETESSSAPPPIRRFDYSPETEVGSESININVWWVRVFCIFRKYQVTPKHNLDNVFG